MIVKKLVSGRLANNCFLVGTGRECIIVDAPGRSEAILYEAKKLGFEPKALFLTHAHFDHVECARELQQEGVPVYAHAAETNKLAKKTRRSESFAYKPLVADFMLKDGQNLTVAGLNILVLHTPGHSAGACCFYVSSDGLSRETDLEKAAVREGEKDLFLEEQAVLFSGDTLFCGTVGRTDLEPEDDYGVLIYNITHKLLTLPPETKVFCGHYADTTIEKESKYFEK